MATKKRKKIKKSTRLLNDIRSTAWYWKLIGTFVIFILGGTFGTQLFTAADDLSMVGGFVLMVLVVWFLILMWMPATEEK